ncbi:MAG: hypothetical protein FWF45_03350 [Coriobacteriia bacterium]|nr:hypothetical protein [Coriobacteriia bacterium]
MSDDPKIGLIVTDVDGYSNGLDRDIDRLTEALLKSGLSVSRLVWHDQTISWDSYDLVIFKSPWDYPAHYAEFMTWLTKTEQQVRMLNSPDLVRWNIDKTYLKELVLSGVPCLDFSLCRSVEDASRAVEELGPTVEHVVIKPTVSAGSRDTALFCRDDPQLLQLVRSILRENKTVMVMPEAKNVTSSGENALYYFNGQYSYSFHKGPVLLPNGEYVGGTYTEDISRGYPSEAEVELGTLAIRSLENIACKHGFADDAHLPLYARADVAIDNDNSPKLIELELFEPSLFADVVPESVDDYTKAVWRRLDASS